MRLIGYLDSEKKAFVFYSFLLSQGIHSTYESKTKEPVAIWIYEEDEIGRAQFFLNDFKEHPEDPKYTKVEFPRAPPQPPDLIAEAKEDKEKPKIPPASRKIRTYPITYLVIFVCVLLYFLNAMQQSKKAQSEGPLAPLLGMTPLQQVLMFEYSAPSQKINALLKEGVFKSYKKPQQIPQSLFKPVEATPSWRGGLAIFLRHFGKIPTAEPVDGPLFVQIKEGQVWRLITPIFLHGGFLHILFNMAWSWILLRQIEERLSRFKILLMILIVGVISNVAQYLVSGPLFVGFSGVLLGLVGFIWARQKRAPWEGYPLNKTTFLFIFIYVGAMFALEILSLLTALIFAKELSAQIANTAHLVGGVVGYLLGRMSFFSRGPK